ncbi:M48 family metallopeptidase, partial [Wolbachia endosymbiont of Pentidionis agamae]|uniref:M48 family metallopeptidase n=1 Tax=Wolbachia endosymbiont of Pentidionis agamae TaxID=3110435 RepID=UPI002FD05713
MYKLIFLLVLFSIHDVFSVELIRDTEIEETIRELAEPLFTAASIKYKTIRIFLLNDNSVNAFITDNNDIFINLGLLRYSNDPHALLGVLAHEIGHMKGNHLLQQKNAVKQLTSLNILCGLISGIMLDYRVASAILLGGLTLSARSFFNYTQEQEKEADDYALKYLDAACYNNTGIKKILGHFKDNEEENTQEYFRTHPPSSKRLFIAQNYKVKNNVQKISDEKLFRFKRIVAKVDSFFIPLHLLLNKYYNDLR